MESKGYLQVHAYTGNAQFPLKDVTVVITEENDTAIAFRLTNQDGQFDNPIEIGVPAREESQTPDPGVTPFSTVNLYARATNYEEIEVNDIQIFSDTTTFQNLELIPLSELPQYWNQVEIFNTPKQNL